MSADPREYTRGFNSQILQDVDKINEKIKEEKDPEELMKLRLQRLYKGMEINTGINRPYGGLYPW